MNCPNVERRGQDRAERLHRLQRRRRQRRGQAVAKHSPESPPLALAQVCLSIYLRLSIDLSMIIYRSIYLCMIHLSI